MDQTNRLLIVSVALVWIFLALLIVLLAWGAPDESIKRLSDLAGYLEKHNDSPAKLIITFGGLILALLGAIVVVYELSPPDPGNVRVDKVGSGDVRISAEEVVQRLEDDLRSIPKVLGVQATVLPRGKQAEVKLDLYVSSDADLAVTSDDAARRVNELVGGRMGVALESAPRVQVHYRELLVARGGTPAATPGPFAAMPPAASTYSERPVVTTPSNIEPSHETTEAATEDHPAGA
jgi:hypothetical protein